MHNASLAFVLQKGHESKLGISCVERAKTATGTGQQRGEKFGNVVAC